MSRAVLSQLLTHSSFVGTAETSAMFPSAWIRVVRALLGLACALLLLPVASSAERRTLVVLHTNDTHAAFLAEPASWREDRSMIGGSVALEAVVRAERTRWQRVLLLDAGDVMTGSPLSELEMNGARGGALLELMGHIGYDAMTIGNHEFDQGVANLEALIEMAPLPVLSANLLRPDGSLFAHAPGKIFEIQDLSIAVVGLITEELDDLLHHSVLGTFEVGRAAEAARRWLDSLASPPDVMIALSHMGLDADRELARALPELDLIVGGHSHLRLSQPEQVGDVLIVQAGSRLKEVGRMRLEVEDGRIVGHDFKLLPLYATDLRVDRELQRLCDEYARQLDELYAEVLGELVRPWLRRGDASNVGIWIAESLADGTDADFGLINNGGIRRDVPAGPVTRLHIAEMLPFQNYVTTFSVDGEQLRSLLLLHARRVADGARGRLQIGHLEARWQRDGDQVELVTALCRGAPIDPRAAYLGASVDFVVVSQADVYLGFEPSEVRVLPDLLATFIEQRIREKGRIDVQADDRLSERMPVLQD